MTWILILHLNAKEVLSCTKLLKYWIAGVTDEFSSETLILPKRLSSLYTKCVQFLPQPSLLFCTCYAGDKIHWSVPPFNQNALLLQRNTSKIHWSSMIFLCTIWVVNMSHQRFRNRWRLILRPQILHIEFNEDQVFVIVWQVTYLRW